MKSKKFILGQHGQKNIIALLENYAELQKPSRIYVDKQLQKTDTKGYIKRTKKGKTN